jgi:signal transduction histidine kinase
MSEESRRLSALRDYRLLDGPADDELTTLVRIAATVAGVPTATLNLIDERRQCQLTTVGFPGADSPREDSMCAQHFEAGEIVHVPDARADPRFADNPWVTGVHARVRFYASAPLVTADGHALGSLCAFHSEPHVLGDEQLARLKDLADLALALFERRRQARTNAHLAAQAEEQLALNEMTLRELEARQAFTDALLDTIDVGIATADETGRLTLFNRAARDLLGLDADARINPDDHAERYSVFAADGVTRLPIERMPLQLALRTGRTSGQEIVIAPPDRPAVTAVCSGRALAGADGSVLGAVVAMTDVTADRTHQRALEVALARLEEREEQLDHLVAELRRSNSDLENFAAVASHDLSSPLTVVAGYLELLQDEHGHALDEQATTWLDTALTSVMRMKGLIGSLLSFASAGSPHLREHADTQELAEHALLDLRSAVEAAGAVVSIRGLPYVDADPTLVRQLLQNLIGNAVKYRRTDRRCRIDVSARRSGEVWELSVADNGTGIAAADRGRVFEMFARVDGVTPSGQGIGLATCARIVAHHGGHIWIDATPGGGTTVRFTLPASAASSGSQSIPLPATSGDNVSDRRVSVPS